VTFVVEDRIRDTSTVTGTGNVSVSGTPPTRYRTFDDVLATNDTFPYLISHQTENEWEVGIGTYLGSDQFSRDTIVSSSSGEGGSPVSFSAGTKDVVLVQPPMGTTAEYLNNTAGRTLMTERVNAAGALATLSDNVGGSVSWDMNDGFNASLALTGSANARTLANPTNPIVGRTGAIVITTSGASQTLAFGTNWEAAGGGGGLPVISTATSTKDIIFYWIQSSTSIVITGILKAVA
jgi:hypothetical protein